MPPRMADQVLKELKWITVTQRGVAATPVVEVGGRKRKIKHSKTPACPVAALSQTVVYEQAM